MAYSYYNYTGDGTTTQFPVAFPYIRREHVLAAVAGSPATFTFVNSSTIQMDVAPANGAVVRVYRQTPLTAPLVDFTDGATLVAADLDTNAKQSIYTQQELSDSQEEGLANVIPNGDKGDVTTSAGGTVWTVNAGLSAAKSTFTQAGTGAVARTVDSKLKDVVSVKDFGAVGDGVADDTAALNAAAAAAGVAKKALLVPAGVYKTTAPWVIPPRVYVKGESHSVQPGYDPGNLWNYGAIIFKAHTGNAITKTGSIPYDTAAPIENITISSNRTTYPGGNGFVLDSVGAANLLHCRAFGIGGDSFVIGVSAATNTGNNILEGCYSNNPTGVNYRIRQGYSRINNCLSDGGTYGMRLDNCPLVVVNNFHFEGFTSAGIYLENGCTNLKFNFGFLVNSAAALYGVQIVNGGGNGHTFNGISVFGGYNTASSVGVSIPSNSVNDRILNCEINNWATGVDNNASFGNGHTWVTDSVFYQNNLAIRSNGENTIYRGNSFDATIGTWDVSHVAGTKGVWSGNTFGKGALGINPVATGVQGNFSGIRVKENTGYVSRNFGTTGSIAAYTNTAHGLAGIPKSQLVLTVNSSGITSVPQIASLDATNFSLYWTGTATPQWNWEAALPCDY
jgi:hypothetical protein